MGLLGHSVELSDVLLRGPERVQFDLSWSQRGIYESFRSNPSGSPVVVVPMRVLDKQSIKQTLTRFAFVASRHSSLRTHYNFDGCASGPVQSVRERMSVPTRMVDTATASLCLADTVHAVMDEMEAVPFQNSGEAPVRLTLIAEHGRAVFLVAALNHLSADAGAAQLLKSEFEQSIRSQDEHVSVSDRVFWESSVEGRAASQRAAEYWTTSLSPLAHSWRRADHVASHHRVEVGSRRLTSALDHLEAKWKINASAILLATTITRLNQRVDVPVCAVELFATNRRSKWKPLVGCLTQSALVIPDIRLADSAASSRHTYGAMIQGLRRSEYSPAEIWGRYTSKGRLNGLISLGFNDVRNHFPKTASVRRDGSHSAPLVRRLPDVAGYLGRFVLTVASSGGTTSLTLMSPTTEFDLHALVDTTKTIESDLVRLSDQV